VISRVGAITLKLKLQQLITKTFQKKAGHEGGLPLLEIFLKNRRGERMVRKKGGKGRPFNGSGGHQKKLFPRIGEKTDQGAERN